MNTLPANDALISKPARKRWLTPARVSRGLRMAFFYALLIPIILFCVAPIFWILKTAFETSQFMFSQQIHWIPVQATLKNFTAVIGNPRAMIGRSFLNSFVVASVSTIFTTIITVLAGYALSRFNFRGKKFFAIYLLMINMVPATLILISMFISLIKIGLVNTHLGLIIYYTAIGLPLAVWMLKSYFDTIPLDLEEQAMVDGATRLEAIRYVILPLALPGIVAVTVYVFLGHWNEFMAAITFIQTQALRTLPAQIINFVGIEHIDWGPVMAYSVLVSLPPVILFIFAQKQFVGGLTSGFTK
jgi:ABC-type glycerol-3-phosphate transport system permease component